MTRFDDGPAKGQNLMLKRAPIFLRVVEAGGKWDGLDQLEDKPAPGEKLYAYRMHGEPGMCHLNFGRKGGGWYPIATYRVVPVQPDDDQMRDGKLWESWCLAQVSNPARGS